MIKDRVEAAKKELGEFIMLFLDETDNKDQLIAMMKEGGEAGLVSYQLFKELSKDDRARAGAAIGYYVAGLFENVFVKYSDEIEVA